MDRSYGGGVNRPTEAEQRTARIAGWLMALTFVTSIPAALILYEPILNETDYILGSGDDTRVTLGALLGPNRKVQSCTATSDRPATSSDSAPPPIDAARSSRSVRIDRRLMAPTPMIVASTVRDGDLPDDRQHRHGVNGILLGYLIYSTGLMPRRRLRSI
jgi:hypothetical protein